MSVFALVCSFLGGVFGAVVGGLQACMIVGFVGIASLCFPSGPNAELLNNTVLGGTLLPFMSFAGGVAAAAYAANIRKHDLAGNNIVKSLCFSRDASVLMIGGAFGSIGYLMVCGINALGIKCDAGSVSVMISALIVRFIFGNRKYFNREATKFPQYHEKKISDWTYNIVFGFFISLMGAFCVYQTGYMFVAFYLSLCSLLLLLIDDGFSPTHHITLVVGYATILSHSILWGVVFGILANILCKLVEDFINTDVNTHIDPPATTIGLLSLVICAVFS